MQKQNDRADIYQIVTDRIIGILETGVVPWRKPWKGNDAFPRNLVSGKAYRGVNVWLLHASGYGSEYWLTYKQAADLGGNVRKGEKSSVAVFWKMLDTVDKASGEKKKLPMLRYYSVFNAEQCEGIEYPKQAGPALDFNPIEACEAMVAGYVNPPTLQHEQARAFYSRSEDMVNMPKRETFTKAEEYYSTLFHEFIHSTGHESRLGRLQNSVSGFGSTSYAKEELVAEMGAAFLCGMTGIENAVIENSAAYIQNWLGRLKDDRKLVVSAAAQAHHAADRISGKATQEVA